LWLKDKQAVSPTNLQGVLRVAALDGDQALFDALLATLNGNPDRRERASLYSALANFRTPALAQTANELMLSPQHDIREIMAAARNRGPTEPVRDGRFEFITRHFDALATRLPEGQPAQFPLQFQGFCSSDKAADVEKFFGPLTSRYEGMADRLKESLENIRLCAGYRAAQQGSLKVALRP
jgi:cytosol alanyl aminopeptidase